MSWGDTGGPGAGLRDAVLALQSRLSGCEQAGDVPVGHDIAADGMREQLLAACESLKNTLSATQAMLAVQLESSVRVQDEAAGRPKATWGRDVAHRVAFARRESPHRGRILLGLAKDLHTDLPHALAAMRAGQLTEFRVLVTNRELGCMDREDRASADAELFAPQTDGRPAEALSFGTRRLAAAAQAIACRLDAAGVARRRARAESERCVTLRPAPEGMAYLTGLLPMAQGIASHVALTARADAMRASGDGRGKGALMADLLVGALTGAPPGASPAGAATAGTPGGTAALGGGSDSGPARASERPPPVGVTVNLVMSDRALFGGGNEPGFLLGRGVPGTPIDAYSARVLIADALDAHPQTYAWIRRLYANPGGQLVGMTSTQRFARGGLAEFLRVRDQGVCRTPWCDAPIAEIDHVVPDRDGGPTDAANLQGLCVACNRAKQAEGRAQSPREPDSGRHTVVTVGPAGQRARSTAPPPPGHPITHPPPEDVSAA